MGILKLNKGNATSATRMNGREYFSRAEKDLQIENLDPVAVQNDLPPLELKDGASRSRVGGSIAHNLKCLNSGGTTERHRRSERFLKQPDKHFPAEEQPKPSKPRK